MALDPELLPRVPELLARIEELEAAAAAAAHVNTSLNEEIARACKSGEAARAECDAWKQRAKWLSSQLTKCNKQLHRMAAAGQSGGVAFDEARAMMDLLDRLEAQGGLPSDTDLQSIIPSPELVLTEAQEQVMHKLRHRGAAAGWLINPSEVQMGPLLGRGEFGVTYKAVWQGATVAVKCVRMKSQQDAISFCRELEALAALRHPHVLPFLGACLVGPDQFWLVTEYMEQGTLAAWLHPHKHAKPGQHTQPGGLHANGGQYTQLRPSTLALSENGAAVAAAQRAGSVARGTKPFLERVRMALEVAQGLQALESLNPPILHRDVKPSNIFVDGAGHARVGDYGLARRLLPEAVADLTGETGTYLYMAPEVMRHEVYDGRADVWSWGVLLVECLNLQTPYAWTFMTPEQIALAVADEQLSPQIPENVDVDLQALARLSLAFNAEERPPFSLLTQEMSKTYHRLVAQAQAGGPTLLSSVSRQLTSTWVGLLNRIYGTAVATADGTPPAGEAPGKAPGPTAPPPPMAAAAVTQ